MKIIIAGGRDFNDYDLLCKKCDKIVNNLDDVEIVSGCTRGADLLGEKYAFARGYGIKKFKPDWDLFGNSAGFRRNEDMSYYADALIAFWDGKSRGTEHMIKIARKRGLLIRVIIYDSI